MDTIFFVRKLWTEELSKFLLLEGPRVIAQSKRMVAAMNHMPLYSLQKLEEEEKTSALPGR